MRSRSRKFCLGLVGALIGVGATLWYWSHTSRHVLAPQPWVSPDEAFTREDRLDIMEAVYRRMCQPLLPAASPQSGAVWLFGVGMSNDPPAELLQRLSDLPSAVKPISFALQKDSSSVDRQAGQRGAAFYIRGAQMTTVDEAQVEGLIQPGDGSSGSEHVYMVSRVGGKWQVTREKSK